MNIAQTTINTPPNITKDTHKEKEMVKIWGEGGGGTAREEYHDQMVYQDRSPSDFIRRVEMGSGYLRARRFPHFARILVSSMVILLHVVGPSCLTMSSQNDTVRCTLSEFVGEEPGVKVGASHCKHGSRHKERRKIGVEEGGKGRWGDEGWDLRQMKTPRQMFAKTRPVGLDS